jgi:hypothetical protein
VAQYILSDRENSVNLDREEELLHNSNDGDFERPETPKSFRPKVDNSLFDKTDATSGFQASLDGIAEIDPMGACLLSLLA